MLLLGIDVGTTGAKATVFDENGNIHGYGFEEYGVIYPRQSWAEQDAEEVWEIAKRVIKQAVKESGPEIHALGLSVQGDAIMPIDKQRRAIANVLLGMDYRGVSESAECEELLGARHLFDITGMRPHPLNSLVKIMWIKNNNPALYEQAWKFVTYSDFILAKLGSDDIVIDYTMASRTMALDLKSCQWSQEILNTLGISQDKLAKPVMSGTVVGQVSSTLASELGLRTGVLIVAGGHDQACAAFGAGVIKENLALDSHGTAEVVSAAFPSPRLDDTMFNSFYPCYLHAVKGMYFTFSLNHTGGILLKWFVEEFCYKDALDAEKANERLYELVLKRTKTLPSPVMVLPYFNGSGTPTCDLNMKGSLLGLTLSTTRHDIAMAIVESLSFEMRLNIETMRKAGIQMSQLRCAGGGARSPIGLQNKADITGLPVATLKIREAACLGAAMLAGIGANVYRDAKEAASIVKLAEQYEPNSELHRIYRERYCSYTKLYDTMKKVLYNI